jgi:hypothetical protein
MRKSMAQEKMRLSDLRSLCIKVPPTRSKTENIRGQEEPMRMRKKKILMRDGMDKTVPKRKTIGARADINIRDMMNRPWAK